MRHSLLGLAVLLAVSILAPALGADPAMASPSADCTSGATGGPDRDGDGISDACDLDDGWIHLEVIDSGTIVYQRESGFSAYNLYRGDLSILRTDPDHMCTQDPDMGHAVRWCDVTSGVQIDAEIPPVGSVMFYVVTGTLAEGETFPGADSAGESRPHHFPCHPCTSDAECSTTSFCAKPPGHCGGRGVCTRRPEACPDVWKPVCGCDGVTYGNRCEAAAAGVSIRHKGECRAQCSTNAECSTTEYCMKTGGDCAGPGSCQARPQACPTVWLPVCGCDGNTYGNACEAAAAGVSVRHPGECVSVCTTNAECATTEFCAKAAGDCGGSGLCRPRPEACPDIFDPVCGCDGVTYGNRCEAAAAGVSVRHPGECVAACTTNAECSTSEFCAKAAGNCSGSGQCRPRPDVCPEVYDPVCGCDGVSYGNACEAAAAGVSVGHPGECAAVCTTNAECSTTEFCGKEPGDCGGSGECRPRPQACPDVFDPVCGCDGVTYGNACEAAAAGVSVRHPGECAAACTTNAECAVMDYCAKAPGDCGGSGRCRPRPEMCTMQYDPVCGCDGRTYGNACEAAAAGVSVVHPGECESRCASNADCSATETCIKEPGDCAGAGICSDRQDIDCTHDIIPVCGCNGRNYTNPCEAYNDGTSVRHPGMCAGSCADNSHCAPTHYCRTFDGCTPDGQCVERPVFCPAHIDPVCGCDGRTYQNACRAAAAGTSIWHAGACTCTDNDGCVTTQFCRKAPLDCGGAGVCADRPVNCPDTEDNICGCDGRRHQNVCTAHRAGVNVGPDSLCTP